MKKIASLSLAAALSISGTAAFAGDTQKAERDLPIAMTDAQLDNISAGVLNAGLINVDVSNVANNNNVEVLKNFNIDVDLNAAAAIAVLGTAGAVAIP